MSRTVRDHAARPPRSGWRGPLRRCGGRPCPPGACRDEASRSAPVVEQALRSPAQSLPGPVRADLEARLGHDFGRVRVHTGDRAAEAATAVDADAFTVGDHVVFGAGRWAPGTAAGRRLLAHELTHVGQPRGAQPGEPWIGRPDDPAEREARSAADAVAAGTPRPTTPHPDGGARRPALARQQAGAQDRPTAPVLDPADPRLRESMERIVSGAGTVTTAVDPACQAPVGESAPWMPARRTRSPVELGEGTRRKPKLKEPDGPAGARCRGACGPDCPDTCRTVGTYRETYEIGNCGYVVEFPDALLCRTHAGCRTHDACFDAAVANGESELGGPRHVACNQQALTRYGPLDTVSWARGGGPYDAWWYFVDDPVVRRSWPLGERRPSAGDGGVTGPI